MRLEVEPGALRELEPQLLEMAPWMHSFRFGPDTIVGSFKYHGIAATAVTSSSAEAERAVMTEAYELEQAGDPFWVLDEALRRLGPVATALDIAAATGRNSAHLALAGVDVLGVEIRPEQVRQAELVRRADTRLRNLPLRFEHDPASADDPAFRDGQRYDLVMSLGLLYHLERPVEHLRVLARLANRAALVRTFTHRLRPGFWRLEREKPTELTKAISGVSWVPYYGDTVDLLHEAGFSKVEPIIHPLLAPWQEPLLAARGHVREGGRAWVKRRLRQAPVLARADRRLSSVTQHGTNPAYFTFLALK